MACTGSVGRRDRPVALAILAALALACIPADPACGHGFSPVLLELREHGDGKVSVEWRTSPSAPPGAQLAPVLPGRCREVSPPVEGATAESFTRSWLVDCGRDGLVGQPIAVRGLDVARCEALVRIALRDGRTVHAVLRAGDPAYVLPARPSRAAVFRTWLALGIEHLLAGPDHLLFLLGLLLLAGAARSIVTTATAFTLGHSLTLALSVLGLARVPQAPVEVLVAASVLTLACEVARDDGGRERSLLRRRPALAAAGFGLLHGLGFAGALREAGLPEGEVPLALLAFNLGIEIAQVAVLGIASGAWLLARRLPGLAAPGRLGPLARLPAEAMGAMSAWWFVERGWALLRGA